MPLLEAGKINPPLLSTSESHAPGTTDPNVRPANRICVGRSEERSEKTLRFWYGRASAISKRKVKAVLRFHTPPKYSPSWPHHHPRPGQGTVRHGRYESSLLPPAPRAHASRRVPPSGRASTCRAGRGRHALAVVGVPALRRVRKR